MTDTCLSDLSVLTDQALADLGASAFQAEWACGGDPGTGHWINSMARNQLLAVEVEMLRRVEAHGFVTFHDPYNGEDLSVCREGEVGHS